MLTFTLAISCLLLLLLNRFSRAQLCVTTETAAHQAPTSPLDHFQFALIHGPDIPGSYAILVFTASDLASITSHIHSWLLFLLWLHPFILSRVIFPLISSSILGTYCPGVPLSVSYHFAFSYCSWGSQGKNTEVACHSLLQWTTFCQASPP